MEENTFVINVGRQLGSGGKEIGLRLADMFEIQCYDKELLVRAAKESGIDADNFVNSDERKKGFRSFFSNFIPLIGSGDFERHINRIRRKRRRAPCVTAPDNRNIIFSRIV